MNTTSASLSTCAADGGGSNVWELVPSGTMPTISARSPMTLAAIEVIGATVVTTVNSADSTLESADSAESVESSELPHAATTNSTLMAAPASHLRESDGCITPIKLVANWTQLHLERGFLEEFVVHPPGPHPPADAAHDPATLPPDRHTQH